VAGSIFLMGAGEYHFGVACPKEFFRLSGAVFPCVKGQRVMIFIKNHNQGGTV